MFSKYDVYTTVQSMYCYPDTDVLINKLDIRDKAELKQAEEEFTAVKQMALLQEPIKGRFTKTHLFRIHRFLFEDVYPCAGQIRKEQLVLDGEPMDIFLHHREELQACGVDAPPQIGRAHV